MSYVPFWITFLFLFINYDPCPPCMNKVYKKIQDTRIFIIWLAGHFKHELIHLLFAYASAVITTCNISFCLFQWTCNIFRNQLKFRYFKFSVFHEIVLTGSSKQTHYELFKEKETHNKSAFDSLCRRFAFVSVVPYRIFGKSPKFN